MREKSWTEVESSTMDNDEKGTVHASVRMLSIILHSLSLLVPLTYENQGAVRANVQTLVALFTLCFFMVQRK